MSFKSPASGSLQSVAEIGFAALENEMLAEKASSLGRTGRHVEKAMAALHAFDAEGGDREDRLPLLKHAARAVWAYFVQRELCGLRDHRDVIRFYNIPQEVLVRLGAWTD
jgi:hypothetical protein